MKTGGGDMKQLAGRAGMLPYMCTLGMNRGVMGLYMCMGGMMQPTGQVSEEKGMGVDSRGGKTDWEWVGACVLF